MEIYEVSKNTFKYGLIDFGEMRPLAENVMKYLKSDVANIKEEYMKLGRHLYEFRNNEYYHDFGYASFEECVQNNLGLDKSSASRCINVWLKFADKTEIKEEYKDYSYSQLVEMVTMENPQIISPDMTVKEIREKKKELKQSSENTKVVTSQLTESVEIKECTSREDLIQIVKIMLCKIDKYYSNVYCTLEDQPENRREIYVNVRKDSKGLEPGKYKLVLQKIKEK